MIEIPCTLRCDQCGETKSVVIPMTAQYTSHSYPAPMRTDATFTINESSIPEEWTLVLGPKDKLHCPRCIEVK
jgi:hypothetical protein